MATAAENIQTRLDKIALELATINWGPNFADQGRSVEMLAYRMSLIEEQKTLLTTLQALSGPFTVIG